MLHLTKNGSEQTIKTDKLYKHYTVNSSVQYTVTIQLFRQDKRENRPAVGPQQQ